MASDDGCNDLHVRVVNRSLIKASDSSVKPHVLVLSNLDLLRQSMQQLSMLCVYPKPPRTTGGDFDAVVTPFEARLPSLLNHFFPLAGRIATNPSSGLPEVHCSNQGAELEVGEAGVALASLDFSVVGSSLRRIIQPPCDDDVALSVQLVSFACGGFTVAWCTHHVLVDGTTLGMVVAAWSSLRRSGSTLPRPPVHDRSLFRPRASPSYGAALDEAYAPVDPKRQVNVLTAEVSFVDRLYYVDAADIARLWNAATRDGGERTTRLSAVSAYLWKLLAGVGAAAGDAHCRMGWWLDGRHRLTAPELRDAIPSYVGNVAAFAVREASARDVLRMPLPDVADMVRDAIAAGPAYDERFQELVDWVENHKQSTAEQQQQQYVEAATLGLGSPAVCVTAFGLQVPAFDTDFGFGRAAMAVGMLAPAATRRMCSGLVQIVGRPGTDGSWIVSAFVWPQLAAAIEADEPRVFKPVTAEYLGLLLDPQGPRSRL